MTNVQRVREAVLAAPGSTNNSIAKKLNLTPVQVACVTSRLSKPGGEFVRVATAHTVTGATIFAYYPASHDISGENNVVFMQPKEKSKKVDNPPSNLDDMLSGFVATFAKSLAEAITAQLKPQLERELYAALPAALPAPVIRTEPVSPPRAPEVVTAPETKRRVGVVGLLPVQAGMLQSEFSDTFDMRFWNGSDGVGSLKSIGIGCEVVFLHTAHLSHSAQETLLSVGAKIVRVGGGMTQMREALTRYYVEEAA